MIQIAKKRPFVSFQEPFEEATRLACWPEILGNWDKHVTHQTSPHVPSKLDHFRGMVICQSIAIDTYLTFIYFPLYTAIQIILSHAGCWRFDGNLQTPSPDFQVVTARNQSPRTRRTSPPGGHFDAPRRYQFCHVLRAGLSKIMLGESILNFQASVLFIITCVQCISCTHWRPQRMDKYKIPHCFGRIQLFIFFGRLLFSIGVICVCIKHTCTHIYIRTYTDTLQVPITIKPQCILRHYVSTFTNSFLVHTCPYMYLHVHTCTYITSPHVTSHYIPYLTLHYITVHYITLHDTQPSVLTKPVRDVWFKHWASETVGLQWLQ